MRAAMALLDATPVPGEGRRIAVLGDMLETRRPFGRSCMPALPSRSSAPASSIVFLAGPEMQALARIACPTSVQVEYRASAEELKPVLLDAVAPGDVVMIKSSKGIGFCKIWSMRCSTNFRRKPRHASAT